MSLFKRSAVSAIREICKFLSTAPTYPRHFGPPLGGERSVGSLALASLLPQRLRQCVKKGSSFIGYRFLSGVRNGGVGTLFLKKAISLLEYLKKQLTKDEKRTYKHSYNINLYRLLDSVPNFR